MNELRVTSHELRDKNNRDAMHRRCRRSIRSRLFSQLATHDSQLATRSATTLIELMITITIIAILSATFLGVSNLAMEGAREARTKTTISKIHSLLMEKWNSYATRRVDVNPIILNNIEAALRSDDITRTQRGLMLADARLLATRELMMREMPDSWSDILLGPVGNNPVQQPQILNAFPALRSTYLRRYARVIFNKDLNDSDVKQAIIENQGAECLYMIVMLATGDGEARTLFSEQDIGDTDEDGAPEFLDGWGRPLHFIRWPAGFAARSDLMSGDADADHDSNDVFRRDQQNTLRPAIGLYPPNPNLHTANQYLLRIFVLELADPNPAYRLMPLIYSAGADGETDIDDQPYGGTAPPTSLDPYAIDPDPVSASQPVFVTYTDNFVFGFPYDKNNDGDDNSLDNIHNHLLDK